ncbi:MAG TPA: MBL fold metallo-hydrolase [Anaeromyxobacteraceae bacterium]|nr:MBL fold metallo-hydrolase [Anaeromyxobacteraceae bacterium]
MTTRRMALLLLVIPTMVGAAELKVTLLGTGRPNPDVTRFGPATLVEAGPERLLFDAGRGASQRLWQLKLPLGQVSAVFFTHLHSDHTVGFPDLWLTGWLPAPFGGRVTPVQVWGPVGTSEMMAGLRRAYDWDIRVRREHQSLPDSGVAIVANDVADEGVVLERNGVKVTAFRVDHGPMLRPAFGYRVDHGGRSVVISGDTRYSENLVRFAEGADVVVHEVAAARPELVARSEVARSILAVHTSPEDAGKVFARVKPRLAVYTHLVLLTTEPSIREPPVDELVARTRTTYPGPLVVGEDLMSVSIGERVVVRRFTPSPGR